MTNHSETTGSSENGDIIGSDRHGGHTHGEQVGYDGPLPCDGQSAYDGHPADAQRPLHAERPLRAEPQPHDGRAPHEGRQPSYDPGPAHQVTLRTPAELADALPYLLGYRPEDSIVLVALHDRGGRGRFGGRARLGIPTNPDDWGAVARQLAQGLVTGSERRGARPAQMVAYLCQEPAKGGTGRQVMERLRPLAQQLRIECGRLDIPVIEALCLSEGRFWSYCCAGQGCCPVEGVPMGLPGTSVMAAAATYAGIQVRGTLRELRARLLPLENGAALEQEAALDTAGRGLVPRILDDGSRAAVGEETIALAARVMRRLAEAPPVTGALVADHRDDALLAPDEAATLILGLQDRVTRDRAAEWMEGDEAAPALRLWRALARRCVGSYAEHAAAPLTLAGWVAWSSGDELEAREALAMALGADPDYLFARLLHQACNEGLDPESVRRCLRSERAGRGRNTTETAGRPTEDMGGDGADGGCGGRVDGEAGGPDVSGVAGDAAASDPPHVTAPVAEPAATVPATSGTATGRRRRRTRPSGATGGHPRAEAGQRPQPRADTVRPRTPARGTGPAAPARGEFRSRSRDAGQASGRPRPTCTEGVQADGGETKEVG
ncbi:DUF4192 family protein [Streptomyces sp. NPDC059894]|uniref:DUF4192 domain-containing protein n=1 Tax=unclassified Streptomyces TaxID=2593676 RepID=UPI00365A52DE